MIKNEYVVTFDELDDVLKSHVNDLGMDLDKGKLESDKMNRDYEIEDLKDEIEELKEENKRLKLQVESLSGELGALYTSKLASIRGTTWKLDDGFEGIIVQTRCNAYMLIDKDSMNRWYDDEFTNEEIISELVKRGWRIKK